MSDDEKMFKFDLLENALDFIDTAIDYMANGSDKKDLKYGILHLSAGVDLVFKYILSQEHWTLLFQNIDEASRIKLESGDLTSVDSSKCIKRLKEICGIELEDKAFRDLNNLRKRRNKLEHFGITESSLAVKASSVKVLHFIFEFINEHVDLESIGKEELELIASIKDKLIKFEDFIAERWKKIRKEVDEFKKSVAVAICPKCYQHSLVVDGSDPFCKFCNYTGDSNDVAEEFINNVLGLSRYEEITQGGDDPLCDCPECGESALVVNIDGDNWICFSCGLEGESIDYCETCGTPYLADEHDIGMCDSCIDYRMRD